MHSRLYPELIPGRVKVKTLLKFDKQQTTPSNYCRQVAFAVRTNVMYDGTLDDECPVHGSAVSFKIGDYLHIFEKFDANWWVGRKVKENCDIGFIPSPDRLEQLILQKAPVGKLDRQKAGNFFSLKW